MLLTARRHIRKMRGGAQSHLLEADDGRFYIVKFQNNPQHRRILVNELVASVFLKTSGFERGGRPHSRQRGIYSGESGVSIELGTRRVPVSTGRQFGSRYPGDPSKMAVYDFVPDTLLHQVRNLSDFLGVLVFDKWVSNADGRQAVFFRARVREWLPGAAEAHALTMGFVGLMYRRRICLQRPGLEVHGFAGSGFVPAQTGLWGCASLAQFEPWLERVMHFPEEVVDQALKQVLPGVDAGEQDQFEGMLEQLMRRRKRVPDLIRDVRQAKVSPFPEWE